MSPWHDIRRSELPSTLVVITGPPLKSLQRPFRRMLLGCYFFFFFAAFFFGAFFLVAFFFFAAFRFAILLPPLGVG